MNVTSISSLFDTQALNSTQQISPLSSSDALPTPGVDDSSQDSGGQPKISKQAQFLNKLQQLKSSDPAKFQQVVTDIAGKLSQAAQQQGQTAQGQFLSNLAAKFQSVAQTGDLSSLQPSTQTGSAVQAAYGAGSGTDALLQNLTGQQGASGQQSASGHHGHHHHGGGSHGGSGAASSTDANSSLTALFSQINQEVAQA